MKIVENKILFLSGEESNAYGGVIGLSPTYEVHGGYDEDIYAEHMWEWEEDKLSKEDLLELADYMIDEWNKFKIKVQMGEIK